MHTQVATAPLSPARPKSPSSKPKFAPEKPAEPCFAHLYDHEFQTAQFNGNSHRRSHSPSSVGLCLCLSLKQLGPNSLNHRVTYQVGTISAAVGILVHYLAEHPDLQQRLRAQPSLLPAAIDEILRIYGPLVANRRITTRPVEIGGRKISAGERISLIWISANRDGRVFEDPEAYRQDRDPNANLLYGAGIHVCPGAPLASMEMRVVMEALLALTTRIDPSPNRQPTSAVYPGSGFATLPLRIR